MQRVSSYEPTQALLRHISDVLDGEDVVPEDARRLARALRGFKDGTLLEVVVPVRASANTDALRNYCSKLLGDLPISKHVRERAARAGVRYVGELMANRDRLRGLMQDVRVGLALAEVPEDIDPLEIEWEPPYWGHKRFRTDLAVLILESCPTPPAGDFVAIANSYRSPHTDGAKEKHREAIVRGLARRWHFDHNVHYCGEMLPYDSCGVSDFAQTGTLLWSKAFLPPAWKPRDWRTTDLWGAELAAIEQEKAEFAAAYEGYLAARQARVEAREAELRKRRSGRVVRPTLAMLDQRWDEMLDISVRAYNCLQNAGIHTFREAVGCPRETWEDIKGFGPGTRRDVEQILADVGLRVGDMNPDEFRDRRRR